MTTLIMIAGLLNPEFSELSYKNPEFSELRIEASRKRKKGHRGRRRGGNGLR